MRTLPNLISLLCSKASIVRLINMTNISRYVCTKCAYIAITWAMNAHMRALVCERDREKKIHKPFILYATNSCACTCVRAATRTRARAGLSIIHCFIYKHDIDASMNACTYIVYMYTIYVYIRPSPCTSVSGSVSSSRVAISSQYDARAWFLRVFLILVIKKFWFWKKPPFDKTKYIYIHLVFLWNFSDKF